MNRLNEMNIADLSENEVNQLMNYEKELNQAKNGQEVYLLALRK